MVPLPDNLNPRAPDLGGAARDPLRGRSGQDSAGRIRLAKQRQKYFGRAAGRDGPRSAPGRPALRALFYFRSETHYRIP
jgi:hypothetical protein